MSSSILAESVSANSPMTVALSAQETRRQVRRALRPAFLLHGDPTDRSTLEAYAFACGCDVAAWHLAELGEFLPDAEVANDAAALAKRTLQFHVTRTDDSAAFCRLYQSGFLAGYHAYMQANKLRQIKRATAQKGRLA